jgi:hypothetical protein
MLNWLSDLLPLEIRLHSQNWFVGTAGLCSEFADGF